MSGGFRLGKWVDKVVRVLRECVGGWEIGGVQCILPYAAIVKCGKMGFDGSWGDGELVCFLTL